MFCSHGKILRVDLTGGSIIEEELPKSMYKQYLGGAGLATRLLWDETPKDADPLGPENRLIFMSGTLTGLRAPSTGRYSVVAKSPLTGIWGQANSGGRWGVDLKRAGFDGIVFTGAAAEPVYLVIDEGKAELKSAARLWGKSVPETDRLIGEELGKGFNVSCIGPAGEKKVLYAAIMNDLHRAAGRCGLGAVMGSKNLKAVAVKGRSDIVAARPEEFKEVSRKQFELLDEAMLKMAMESYGTNVVLDLVNVRGGFPTRNWQAGECDFAEEFNAQALADRVLTGTYACYACPIACGRRTEIKTGPYAGHSGEGPEYETVGVFGGMCCVKDLEAITMAGYLCNELGLDTISCGSTIAFAMECFEKGILTAADTGGMRIDFGDAAAVVKLVEMIALREGVGDLLAEGSRNVAARLGGGSEKFAMHVKGLELPAYDSRAVQLTGLTYATANRGGDHITAWVQGPTFVDAPFLIIPDSEIADPLVANPAEVKVARDLEDALTTFDCVGACKFMGLCLDSADWVNLVNQATGWEMSVEDYMRAGERVYNLARAYSVREGLTAAGDTLPERLLKEPLPGGPAEGHVNELPVLLEAYYALRGWDPATGKPTPEKLRELDLADLIPSL